MKKIVIRIIIAILVFMFLGILLFGLEFGNLKIESVIHRKNNSYVEDKTNEQENITSKNQSNIKDNVQNKFTDTNNSKTHYEYTHIAIEGCVITESDKLTGLCVYKEKCPTCGQVSPGSTSEYLQNNIKSAGTCSNSKCSNWGKPFTIKIETNAKLVKD